MMGGTLSVSGFRCKRFPAIRLPGRMCWACPPAQSWLVGAVMIFGMKLWGHVPFGAVMTAAFVGAMLCASFVMIVSRKIHSMAMLLVVGMMIGNVCSAATDFFVTFAKEKRYCEPHQLVDGQLFWAVSWGKSAHLLGGDGRPPLLAACCWRSPSAISVRRTQLRRAWVWNVRRFPCGADRTFLSAGRVRDGACRPISLSALPCRI